MTTISNKNTAGQDISFGSRTDIGYVRDHNEDSLIIIPPLFAVADGMGGHEAGEIASEITVNTLAELCTEPSGCRRAHRCGRSSQLQRDEGPSPGHRTRRHGHHAHRSHARRRTLAHRAGGRFACLPLAQRPPAADHARPFAMVDLIEAGQMTPKRHRLFVMTARSVPHPHAPRHL